MYEIRDRATRQLGFPELVFGAQRKIELLRARHAVHDEAEGDVAAAALRRAALDVADLPDPAVVLDDVAALDFRRLAFRIRLVTKMPIVSGRRADRIGRTSAARADADQACTKRGDLRLQRAARNASG